MDELLKILFDVRYKSIEPEQAQEKILSWVESKVPKEKDLDRCPEPEETSIISAMGFNQCRTQTLNNLKE